MPRESTTFKIFQRSTEGAKIALRADEFNTNFAEVCNGKALDDGCIIARHLGPALIAEVFGIRAGVKICSSTIGESYIVFSSALADVNYAVSCTFESALVGGLTVYIKDKTVAGFTACIIDGGSNLVDCSIVNISFSWLVINNF